MFVKKKTIAFFLNIVTWSHIVWMQVMMGEN